MTKAPEMPISQARDHFADLVNRAAYGGATTYVTRRGRRVAAVVSASHLAVDMAQAREAAVADVCRELWRSVRAADEDTRTHVREVIDSLLEQAEEATDAALVDEALAELDAGAATIPMDAVRTELGL